MDNVIFGRAEQWLSGVVQDTGLGIPGAAGGNRKAGSVFAVVDGNVAERLAPVLKAAGIEWMPFVAREERKSINGLQEIVGWLLEREADRSALLLGIGGGVTTDITAFTASVYKRGIRYALVPTTLLAQVDAAIGGKTGLNFHGYKNIIGTFGTPEAVCVDVELLGTLPAAEVRSGMAEVLKTLIIGDAELYHETVRWYGGVLERRKTPGNEVGTENVKGPAVQGHWDAGMPGRIVRRCVEIKSAVVKADRTEKGERMKLNLGHTLGHAVESVCLNAGRAVTHGEAVAAGIMAAAEISRRRGVLAEDVARAVVRDFKSLGYRDIPEILASCSEATEGDLAAKLSDFVLNDKKRKEDFINFVLIQDLGSVMVEGLSIEEIQEVINDLRKHR